MEGVLWRKAVRWVAVGQNRRCRQDDRAKGQRHGQPQRHCGTDHGDDDPELDIRGHAGNLGAGDRSGKLVVRTAEPPHRCGRSRR